MRILRETTRIATTKRHSTNTVVGCSLTFSMRASQQHIKNTFVLERMSSNFRIISSKIFTNKTCCVTQPQRMLHSRNSARASSGGLTSQSTSTMLVLIMKRLSVCFMNCLKRHDAKIILKYLTENTSNL